MRRILLMAAVAVTRAQSADPVSPCATLPRARAKNFETKLEAFLNASCHQKQGWVHAQFSLYRFQFSTIERGLFGTREDQLHEVGWLGALRHRRPRALETVA